MSESFGTYRLLRLLGQGATATVQLAERTDSAEPIVVKRLRADVAHEPRFVQALRAEAELGLRLQHPSIVRVLELGEVDGEWLLTMEYVDGITLRALLQRDAGALPPRVALFVAARIADALAYAHALAGDDGRPLQLVHRDVNPTNIMLSKSGDVKLLDFGIARTAGLAHADTDPGARQGTLRYMSPEQARGLAVDGRSDQFSLGIVLYECLTGQRLFLGDDEWQTIRLICEAPIAAPSRLRPELGGDVDAVALTLLARDPAARFATTAAAAEALRRLAPSADDGAAELRALVARAATATTTPTPSQPAVITLDDGAPRSGFGRVVARAPLLLLFAFMLGVGAALFPGDPAASWRIARRSPRPALVVLGLANGTGRADDDWIAPTSQEMLGIALAPSERLHVLDGDRVARMQRELDVRPAPSLSPADAARIGRDLDADLVVTGVVTRTPPQAHVALRVQETKSGATRALVDESGAERDLLTLLGRAATRLRATLGERLDSVAAAESSARALLPASIDAARAYADGVARLRDGDFVHAREQLARAVALDPQNARAHLMLARLLANVGYAADARDEADRAFALRLALPRELRLIVAAERDRLNKRWRDAIDRDQLLFQLFPDNLEYGLALVHAQWDGAANRAARATVQTLLALPGRDGRDPRVEIAHAVVANGMGARDESDRAAAHALQLAQARGSELQIADAELLQSQAAWKDCAWATARARAAEATFRRLGDPRDAVAARQVIGLCLQRQGDSAGALAAFEDN
ncbi:MAG TPA: protein kinase, partial [Polyangia bacterium]|nr:protein kinase [Polyangia bacterium]